MSNETIDETLEKWSNKTEKLGFTICGCRGKIVKTEDGKKHFEMDCLSKEARDELASILEEESILRINPKVILEEPAAEPAAESTES
ncbi:unnamed protein product [marine sediment metagenome]|uniref:Uncharacterized protein n=1 Tax=marine sediment metagenome TaxID=412755 RepID=X1UFZ8_9ZZZZ